MNGISSVTDSPRPGQAHPVVTPEAISEVEAIVKENRRVTVNEIAAHLDMSHGSAHRIVSDKKKLKKKLYLRFSFDSPSYLSAGLIGCVQCFESGCSSVQGVMTIMRTAPPCPGARREASVTMLTPQYHSTFSGQ